MSNRNSNDRRAKAIADAAALVGVRPDSLARMTESKDRTVRLAARAISIAPKAAKLRAFLRRIDPGDG